MTKADIVFKEYIRKIMEEGVWSEQARPKYKDGRTANSKYITGAFMEFDLAKGEFPITTLRPIAIKSAIKELSLIHISHLAALAELSKYLMKPGFADKLRQASTPDQVIAAFDAEEQEAAAEEAKKARCV